MADDFYGFEEEQAEEKGRDNLFLWTVFILLLIGTAFACWLGSFYIFGHPEQPRAYKLLKKLGKIEAPKRFEVTAAPRGDFLTPQKLFERYSGYTRLELENENAELIRNYIKNYRETKKMAPYITGRFSIISAYELKPQDLFPSGMVALGQSIDYPQVLIEHVYPAAKDTVASLRVKLQSALDMNVRHNEDCAAILHIEKIYDGRLKFTVVSLLYGTYALKNGSGMFSLEPPRELNMEAGVPLIKEQTLKDALAAHIKARRNRIATVDPGSDTPQLPTGPEIVRIDTAEPGSKVPETGALPAVPIATPVPLVNKGPPKAIAVVPPPAATPALAIAMLATPTPRAAATPVPVATPLPIAPPPPIVTAPSPPLVEPVPPISRPMVSPDGVPLQPFIASAPAPGTLPPSPGAKWRTYAPGKAPPARAITPAEATTLAGRGADLGERLYLRGDFRVTASGDNRAVLRDRNAAADPGNPVPAEAVRIIVEYPAGALPPAENATFSRDSARPFEIRDVRKGLDGQINIYVREITAGL